MIKSIVLIFILLSSLFSSQFYLNPYFEKKVINNTKSYNILNNYVQFLNQISSFNNSQKIERVNNYINAIIPRYDAYNYSNEDYWASPFEFFSHGGGDCEDYVIAKQYTLTLLGIPKEDMYYHVVEDRYTGGYHMVLTLHKKKQNSYVVLDNLSTIILPWQKRVDLKSSFLFNQKGFYRFNQNLNLINIKRKSIPAYNRMQYNAKHPLILIK